MKIRKATIKDIGSILNLQKSYNENYWTILDFKKAMRDKKVIFLVAEENEKIIGSVIGFIAPTKKTDAMLHETRVDRNEQGRGIGLRLVNEFCKIAFNKGAKNIYAQIKDEHVKFYVNRCGFKISDEWIEVKKSQ